MPRTPYRAPGSPDSAAAYRWYFTGYLCLTLVASVVHGFLPAGVRAVSFFVVASATVPAIAWGLSRFPPAGQRTYRLLLTALTVLSAGNLSTTAGFFGPAWLNVTGELLITLGHLGFLLTALSFVRLRGRNDTGGLLDVAVFSVAGGGLLWTAVVQPRLAELDIPLPAQAGLLFNILVLIGVLGALLRLAQTAREAVLALRLIVVALVLTLIGNFVMAMTTGWLATNRPGPVEAIFLMGYSLIGATGLHPSLRLLATPGPAPTDRLTPGRLVFLGAALALPPVAGAGRQLLGLPVDGLLLAANALFAVPLVMTRVGYLAHQRVQAEQKLVHQATHDGLTGLTNRAEFLNRLADALARRAAGGRQDILLLFCDLDGFKAVNDRLGHTIGDELLISVSRRLARTIARDDTLARYGGDEFLIMCETTNPVGARTSVSRRVIAALADPFDLAGERVSIGITIGAVVAEDDDTADSLIHRADGEMYAAKNRRRMRHRRTA